MPDPLGLTVSASQAAALFNQHPRMTLWMLYQHHAKGLPLDEDFTQRMAWGKLLQEAILKATALQYRLEVIPNSSDEYTRSGLLGATIDGAMHIPDKGLVVVEAKNIDRLIWRDTWTPTMAAPHVEIQLQTQMLAAKAEHGIIAALIGGNEVKWYERTADRSLARKLRAAAKDFFARVKDGREPDPLARPIELPMLQKLYPEADPLQIIEDYEDADLAIAARQLRWAQEEESFAGKLKSQLQVKILARTRGAGILKVNGARVQIKKIPIKPTICQPHSEPFEARRASVQTRITIEPTEFIRPLEIALPRGIAP